MRNFTLLSIIILSAFSCKEDVKQADSVTNDLSADSLDLVLAKNPGDPQALYSKAKQLYTSGQYTEAMEVLNKKMALDQNDEDFLLKGKILFSDLRSSENITNARKAFRISLKENPKNAEAYVKLAQIQQLLENHNRAIELVDSGLRINQYMSDAYFIKGFTFELRRAKGDTALAISSYQTAIEVNPDFYDAYIRLGDLHAGIPDSLALQYYQSAIDIQPNRVEAYYNKGIFLQNLGELDRAMDTYDKMLVIDENSFPALYNQGYLLLVYANEYEEAVLKFNRVISIKPDYAEAYHNRGLALKYLGRYEEAKKDFSKALEIIPDFDLPALELSDLDGL